jgi:hypothetical protein
VWLDVNGIARSTDCAKAYALPVEPQVAARSRPQWREQRDWLREHGAELLALDPAD